MTAERWQRIREVLYAAIEKDVAARGCFLRDSCGEDGQLRGEVERLLAAFEESGAFLEPNLPAERPAPEVKIGPYLILEQAGEGGMGTVYRAVRDDYRQQVAVKLVKREAETGLLLARFRQERQVLALLNHPNIARLLDGGTTSGGRPYLVMEWVDGVPITEYCRRANPPLRLRLELFLDVCHAVAHAHGNLVVHRDLKPSNILITPQGVPKLLDFGIAKILSPGPTEEDATMTLAGTRALTPDYASPEQVRGEPITTATDIYSLGAVLYELLTGVRPHRFETRTGLEIERVVCTESVVRPSLAAGASGVAARELHGDLDNIVLKAMEKDRMRRYSHIEEFAADLQRYLEGRPVLAQPASYRYRAWKFVRRNRVLVVAAAGVAAALILGLAAALWQARIARQERQAADRRFELARRVAASLLYDVHDQIQDLAGSSKAREFLLRRSLEYLDALSNEASANAALQRDLANAYVRAATLQGVTGVSNLGTPAAARRSLQKALALLERARAAEPQSPETRRDLAIAHREFVSLGGAGDEMLPHAQTALALVDELVREHPADRTVLNELEKSEFAMARSLTVLKRYPEAIGYYRRALSHCAASPAGNVALDHKSLGAVLIQTGSLDEALNEYRAAASIDEQRVSAEPANGRARLDLSYDYADWGLILMRLRQAPAAVERYRKAVEIRSAMAAADPRDARALTSLVSADWRLGWALSEAGDRNGAARVYRDAIRTATAMMASLPDSRIGTQSLADACWNIGSSYKRQWHSCGLAVPQLQRAHELFRQLNEPTPLVDQALAECGASGKYPLPTAFGK
jgi:tetratricopeptide (TPR) repeat protein